MLILIEGIVVCFILLMACVLVLKDGPEKCAVFHEKNGLVISLCFLYYQL